MKSIFIFFITLFYCTGFINAQPYVEGGKTRFRFAQINFGLDCRMNFSKGSGTSTLNSSGELEQQELQSKTDIRMIIGGTHFWGHADFYMVFPLTSFGKNGISIAEEIGAKYYPWRIENKKIRPYIGMSMLTSDYQQGEGVSKVTTKYPLTGGFVFNYKRNLFELGGGYLYHNQFNYYINTTTPVVVKAKPYWIALSYKVMIDLTIKEEKDWDNGKTKRMTDSLSLLHRLDGLTIAIGPSAAFYLQSSPHNESVAPYIDNHKVTKVFPEFGLGYYLHRSDLQFNFTYRRMKSELAAYGFTQIAKRQAITFETYKFICDYNGFDAFIGPAVSYEQLYVSETDASGIKSTGNYQGVKPGITFGWDIRPNSLQIFYLRTNLRYFPNLNVKMYDNNNVAFSQLEFNFIQLVIFPERIFSEKKSMRN
jgi:hypothetical protein